jgi:hypothetical protein
VDDAVEEYVTVAELVSVEVADCVTDGEVVMLGVADPVPVTLVEAVTVLLLDWDAPVDRDAVGVSIALLVTLELAEKVALTDADIEAVCEVVTEAERDLEEEREADGGREAERLAVGVAEAVEDTDSGAEAPVMGTVSCSCQFLFRLAVQD